MAEDKITVDAPEPSDAPSKPSTPHSKSGWDGKLRVNKQATLANPEALSDPEYSDDDAPPICWMTKIRVQRQVISSGPHLQMITTDHFQDIDVQHSRITSIPALRLERFPNLRRLGLRQNSIQNIELPESIAPQLEELELYDNLVKHIAGLEECKELQSLDLSYNKLKHIKNLSNLKKLDHLYFVQNRLSKIENLEELVNLTYLELGANRIREIAGLETLTKLEHL
ncbi:L domain-like protein, partial [Hortaea werneckii]